MNYIKLSILFLFVVVIYMIYKDTRAKFKKIYKNQLGYGNNNDNNNKKYITKIHTYDDYLEFSQKNIGKNCKWIYDIIDNNNDANLDRLLLVKKDFVLVKEMHMKDNDINSFHLLAFPKNKEIKTIRDLTRDDIPLLQTMVATSKRFIKDKYKINKNEIEAHFHYPPGVLLLHIHFELTNSENKKCRKPLREHAVSRVIENLLIDSDYYKKIKMEYITKE